MAVIYTFLRRKTMGAVSSVENEANEIVDNISDVEVKEEPTDEAKLSALKAKSQAKQNQMEMEKKMSMKIVGLKEKALRIGCVGSGQAGGRLASQFCKAGYPSIACNTATQDLKLLDLNDSNKLLLEYGVGGASKELSIGHEAALAHKDEILQLVNEKLGDTQVNILCFSLGGGSGAGSSDVLIDLLTGLGKPLVVITILPLVSDDLQTKQNSLEVLSKLATFARNKKISNLIVIDNAKIENIFKDAPQFSFFDLANQSIVNTFDTFNSLSSQPSASKGIDPMEFSKLLIDAEGLSVYGEFSVENYTEDTAIAEAVVNNLNNNLLASGFDLKQSKYVGFIVTGNKQAWDKVPASSINYASAMINDLCGHPKGVFKGSYITNMPEDVIRVYSFFSGLSLPSERIDQLKAETVEMQTKNKGKDEQRNLSLQLNHSGNESVSQAQQVKNKIAQKASTFGKFVAGTVDRRK
jgi:tubulin-like protein CetZ